MAARNAKYADGEEAAEVAGSESISNAVEGDAFDREVGNFIAGANQNNKFEGSSVCHCLFYVLHFQICSHMTTKYSINLFFFFNKRFCYIKAHWADLSLV